MLPRCAVDAICRQISYLRPFGALGSQTALWYSKSVSYPPPPKRNMSAYMWFMKDTLPTVKKENPNSKHSEIFSMASDKWRKLDQTTLEKYQQVALKDKQQYLKALEKYQSSLTSDMKLAIARSKEVDAKNKQKKQLRALGMPKRPPNAYILFFMDYMKKNGENPNYFKDSHKGGAAWARLSDSEKAKWNELALAKEKEYKIKLEQWEAEMVSKGHLEVIHTKGKPEL